VVPIGSRVVALASFRPWRGLAWSRFEAIPVRWYQRLTARIAPLHPNAGLAPILLYENTSVDAVNEPALPMLSDGLPWQAPLQRSSICAGGRTSWW